MGFKGSPGNAARLPEQGVFVILLTMLGRHGASISIHCLGQTDSAQGPIRDIRTAPDCFRQRFAVRRAIGRTNCLETRRWSLLESELLIESRKVGPRRRLYSRGGTLAWGCLGRWEECAMPCN